MSHTPVLIFGRNKPLALKMEQSLKSYVEDILIVHNYRTGKTAEALGISRTSLWRIMKKYGIIKVKKSE